MKNSTEIKKYTDLLSQNNEFRSALNTYNIKTIKFKEIGKGGFGKVYHLDKTELCVKIIDPITKFYEKERDITLSAYLERYQNKYDHLSKIAVHDQSIFALTNIIQTFQIIDTSYDDVPKVLYVFLMKKLKNVSTINFTYDHMFDMTIQLCRILDRLHNFTYGNKNYGLLHLDIKPDNIMYQEHSINLSYHLIDFEDSFLANESNFERDYNVISEYYSAPEITHYKTSDKAPCPSSKSDMFSLAASVFSIVSLQESNKFYNVTTGLYNFEVADLFPLWKKDCLSFLNDLKQCLDKNPENRLSAHDFLVKYDSTYNASTEKQIAKKIVTVNEQINHDFFKNYVHRKIENELEKQMQQNGYAILWGKLGTGKHTLVNHYIYKHQISNFLEIDCRSELALQNSLSDKINFSNQLHSFIRDHSSDNITEYNFYDAAISRILSFVNVTNDSVILFSNVNYQNDFINQTIHKIIDYIKNEKLNTKYVITTTYNKPLATIEVDNFTHEEAIERLKKNGALVNDIDAIISKFGTNPLIISGIATRTFSITSEITHNDDDMLKHVICDTLNHLKLENSDTAKTLLTILKTCSLLSDTIHSSFLPKILKTLCNTNYTISQIDECINRTDMINRNNDIYVIVPEIQTIIKNWMEENEKLHILNVIFETIIKNIDFNSFDHMEQSQFVLNNRYDIFTGVNYPCFTSREETVDILISLHYYVGQFYSETLLYNKIVEKINAFRTEPTANKVTQRIKFLTFDRNKLLFDSWHRNINAEYIELVENLNSLEIVLPKTQLIRTLYILSLLNLRIEHSSDVFAKQLNQETLSLIKDNKDFTIFHPDFNFVFFHCVESLRLLSQMNRGITGYYDIANNYTNQAFELVDWYQKQLKIYGIILDSYLKNQIRFLMGNLYNNRGILKLNKKRIKDNSYHIYCDFVHSYEQYFPFSIKNQENEVYNIAIVYNRRIEELIKHPRSYVYSLELAMSYLDTGYELHKQISMGNLYLCFYNYQRFHACIALSNLFRDNPIETILYEEEVSFEEKYYEIWKDDGDFNPTSKPLYIENMKNYHIYDILEQWFQQDIAQIKQWSRLEFQQNLLKKCLEFLDVVKKLSVNEVINFNNNLIDETHKISSKRHFTLSHSDSGLIYRKLVQLHDENYNYYLAKGIEEFNIAITFSKLLDIPKTLAKAYPEFAALYECSNRIGDAIAVCEEAESSNISDEEKEKIKNKKLALQQKLLPV